MGLQHTESAVEVFAWCRQIEKTPTMMLLREANVAMVAAT